ncbi:MAG TPA: FecR/PupR family sigma factor regulator, partial [Sphingomonas sp.]
MEADQSDIIDQAIGWHLRLADADEHGWADFIAWIEASPAHAAAYDSIAADDRLIGQARFPAAVPEAGND